MMSLKAQTSAFHFGTKSTPKVGVFTDSIVEGDTVFFTFPVDKIEGLYAIDPNITGILLQSGIKIPVLMGMEELANRLEENNVKTSHMIDLRPYSGSTVQKALKEIRAADNERQMAEIAAEVFGDSDPHRPSSGSPKITMLAHRHQTDSADVNLVTLPIDNIHHLEPNNSAKSTSTYVHFKAAMVLGGKTATGLFVDIPPEKFTRLLDSLSKRENASFDLSSLQKSTAKGYRPPQP